MRKLTDKQFKALKFIYDYQAENQVAPTLREVCQHMGYRAIGSAQDIINALRQKAYLTTPDRQSARALLLSDAAKQLFTSERDSTNENTLQIPCIGEVPAGLPIEAIEQELGFIEVSRKILPSKNLNDSELFALQAKGESMIGAGILNEDWLIVRTQETATEGSIVVARTGSDSVTVKRLMKETKKGWFLKSENPNFNPIYADVQEFSVIGKVVAVMRSLS